MPRGDNIGMNTGVRTGSSGGVGSASDPQYALMDFIGPTSSIYVLDLSGGVQPAGWLIERDWNDGVVGEIAIGTDGFDSEAGWSTYDDSQFHSGTQCCRCLLKKDVTVSTFLWGGRVNFLSPLVEGDVMYHEVWLRAPAFENFNFDTIVGFTKFLRYEHDSTYSKLVQLRDTNLSDDYNVSRSGLPYLNFGPDGTFKWETWQKYQVEVGIGIASKDDGGNGYMKMWVDGVKLLDETNFRTINEGVSTSWIHHRFMNTWSPNEPLTYDIWMWIDDLMLTDTRPGGWPT